MKERKNVQICVFHIKHVYPILKLIWVCREAKFWFGNTCEKAKYESQRPKRKKVAKHFPTHGFKADSRDFFNDGWKSKWKEKKMSVLKADLIQMLFRKLWKVLFDTLRHRYNVYHCIDACIIDMCIADIMLTDQRVPVQEWRWAFPRWETQQHLFEMTP